MKIEEQKYFEVRDFLDKEIVRLGNLMKEYRANIKMHGEDFKMDNPNGGMYSGMELTEVHYEMEKQMLYAAEADNDIYFYRKLRNAPYFAKIVFKADGATRANTVYIGLRTLQDPDTFRMYVCDWRAPIASLFYDDFEGKAFFEAPKGQITGDLLLKRQFKFGNGKLLYYVDSDLKIDDDILRDVLSSSSGEHLKVIVNSIQREQNKVIRYSDAENLLVTGPAGSGKTSVGFHRLAYLLYRNRTELSSAEIIMFSNNDIFSSYVADIIPELGEMPINYASFYSVFAAEIPAMPTGDYYTLADDVINGNVARLKSASVKVSRAFADYLDEAVEKIEPEFCDITVEGNVIITAQQLLYRFNDDTENSQKTRGERLASYAQGEIDRYFIEHRNELYQALDEETTIDEDTSKVLKRLRREIKSQAVEMIKNATLQDPVQIYFRLLKAYADSNNMPELLSTYETLKRGFVEFEDAIGILYVKTVFGTAAVLSGVKHILIDEAQDLSFMQHRIIRRMFPRARFTLLGDTNQAILSELNITDSEQLADIYSAKHLKLNKSYRSTKQINSYALKLLDESERYEIFEREGVEISELSGTINAFSSLIKNESEERKTLAIIVKTTEEARELYGALKKELDGLRLCDNKSCELSDAPVIIPLALTKGLEFDSVIVVDKNGGFTKEENKRLLYLASTRALHKLTVFRLSCKK